MFVANMMASSLSHWALESPTSCMNHAGSITRKPNCEAVLSIRTTAPAPTRGSRTRMVRLPTSPARGLSPAGASRAAPVGSRTRSSASSPPTTTTPRAAHRVPRSPTAGMSRLAVSEPSVGRPAENADQNQPIALPICFGGATAAIQTRNAYANKG